MTRASWLRPGFQPSQFGSGLSHALGEGRDLPPVPSSTGLRHLVDVLGMFGHSHEFPHALGAGLDPRKVSTLIGLNHLLKVFARLLVKRFVQRRRVVIPGARHSIGIKVGEVGPFRVI